MILVFKHMCYQFQILILPILHYPSHLLETRHHAIAFTKERDGSPWLETRGGSRQRFQPPSIFSSLIIGLMTADRLHPQLVAAILTNFPNSRALKYAGIDCLVGIL